MTTLSNWELWACASQQVAQFGIDATFAAARRADALLDAGDIDGHATWLAILSRIEVLTSPTGSGVAN